MNPLFETSGWLGVKLTNLFWWQNSWSRAFPLYVVLGTIGVSALWLAQAIPLLPARWRAGLERTLDPLSPFILYSLVNFVAYAVVLQAQLSWAPWYYVIQPWLTVLLAVAGFDALWRLRIVHRAQGKRVLQFVLCGVLLLPLLILARQLWNIDRDTARGARLDPLYEGAAWAKTHLAPDAVIGSWNAGTIGYLSERRTVNLDGVVNSYRFFETDRFDLCAYWKKQGVTYLIDAFEQDRALSVVPTFPTYESCAFALREVWSDARYRAIWQLKVYRLDWQ